MKKLTDVYIKVTKQNKEELKLILKIPNYNLELNSSVNFIYDCLKSSVIFVSEPKNKQKVSLTELKRLIDTIPTREEIKRLKAQVNYYKVGYKKTIQESNERANRISLHANELKERFLRLSDNFGFLQNENDNYKKENQELSKMYDDLVISSFDNLRNFNKVTEDLSDGNFQLRKENAKLKQRKWWQIWK